MKKLMLLFLLVFCTGCGFITEQFRDEIQRQIILNKMQNLVEGVETQATIDALLRQGGDRYMKLTSPQSPGATPPQWPELEKGK